MLDRLTDLFSKPTQAKLAKRVVERLQAQGAANVTYDAGLEEVRAEIGGSPCAMSLSNLWHEYSRAKPAQRDAIFERFLAGVVPGRSNELPAAYAAARERLLPIVRHAADDAMTHLLSQRLAKDGDAPAHQPGANRPLLQDKIVGLAYDTPDAMVRLTRKQLEDWGVGFESALDDALHNLRALPEHGGWRSLAPGLWSGEWGDSYESSRVLLPDLVYRLGISDPVAMVPLRNSVLVAGAADEAALSAMARTARAGMDANTRWLSPLPMRLVDSQWQAFEPPASCKAAFDELASLNLANLYQGQKQELDALFERERTDIFVASSSLVRMHGADTLRSYCVWSRDVDTLLPQTDLVALHDPAQPQTETLMVSWAAVQAIAGAHLQATDHVPTRWRVKTFPDDAQLTRLRAAQSS